MENKNLKKLIGKIIGFHLLSKRKSFGSGFHTGMVTKVHLDKSNEIIIRIRTLNPLTKLYDGCEIELIEKEWTRSWCGVEINKKIIPIKEFLN